MRDLNLEETLLVVGGQSITDTPPDNDPDIEVHPDKGGEGTSDGVGISNDACKACHTAPGDSIHRNVGKENLV